MSTCIGEKRVVERSPQPTILPSQTAMASDGSVTERSDAFRPVGLQLDAGVFQRCESLLARFELRLAVSPSDDELTSVVAAEMKKRQEPFPANYKFLIGRRGRHWIVTVIDFEAVCRGERPSGNTFHLEKKAGRVRLLFEAANI
jgi:hypothetical protein